MSALEITLWQLTQVSLIKIITKHVLECLKLGGVALLIANLSPTNSTDTLKKSWLVCQDRNIGLGNQYLCLVQQKDSN